MKANWERVKQACAMDTSLAAPDADICQTMSAFHDLFMDKMPAFKGSILSYLLNPDGS